MTQRILSASFTFTAGAFADIKATVDQTKLDAAIDHENFMPHSLRFNENANITLTKLVLQSVKNPERVLVIIPDTADGVSLADVNAMVEAKAGGITGMLLKTTHGVELVASGSNADAGTQSVAALMKVHNLIVGPQSVPGRDSRVQFMGPTTENSAPVGLTSIRYNQPSGAIGTGPLGGDLL